MSMYIQTLSGRQAVETLQPCFRDCIHERPSMDPTRMRKHEREHCQWVWWRMCKGITRVRDGTTVLSTLDTLECGIHAELMQGFEGVDPPDIAYDAQERILGFDDFIRWAYFTNPRAQDPDVLGIDWSLREAKNAGVAISLKDVTRVAQHLLACGMNELTHLALLNCRMCEDEEMTLWKKSVGLATMNDWAYASALFVPHTTRCFTCGVESFVANVAYCHECGCAK